MNGGSHTRGPGIPGTPLSPGSPGSPCGKKNAESTQKGPSLVEHSYSWLWMSLKQSHLCIDSSELSFSVALSVRDTYVPYSPDLLLKACDWKQLELLPF